MLMARVAAEEIKLLGWRWEIKRDVGVWGNCLIWDELLKVVCHS